MSPYCMPHTAQTLVWWLVTSPEAERPYSGMASTPRVRGFRPALSFPPSQRTPEAGKEPHVQGLEQC